jgi:hypothetical protein
MTTVEPLSAVVIIMSWLLIYFFSARFSGRLRFLGGFREWMNDLSDILVRKSLINISIGWLTGNGLGSRWDGGRNCERGWGIVEHGGSGWLSQIS